MPQLLTIRETGDVLRLKPGAIRTLIRQKKLAAVQLNARCIRVRRDVLEAFIANAG